MWVDHVEVAISKPGVDGPKSDKHEIPRCAGVKRRPRGPVQIGVNI